MPRMYMAIAQEDRHAITDILRQTPEIPDTCQWGIFLRNHDELTLEMVTDMERDYLWKTYAVDPRARINLGIRRRLAPLMENDRRKIELMNALLLSMPGTPILYYGDEIGMGDNIFLGDRNGVRTPMQWTPDRNGGFSRTDPARLFLPPLMDPVYGYQSINVEAQSRSPSSLLNWTKRMIAVRQSRKVFGRGTLKLVYPKNRRILAYLREFEGETVLCIANLSRHAQPVELDLQAFRGLVPVELVGRSPFPQIGAGPYVLTCPGYAFYWFLLADPAKLQGEFMAAPDATVLPEYVTVVWARDWQGVVEGRGRQTLERDILPTYLPQQRWFSSKNAVIESCRLVSSAVMGTNGRSLLTVVEARSAGGAPSLYFLPVVAQWTSVQNVPAAMQSYIVAKVRQGPQEGIVFDAAADESFALTLLDHIVAGRSLPASNGRIVCTPTAAFAEHKRPSPPVVRSIGREQSNSSIMIEDHAVLKLYRSLGAGNQTEIEMGRFLTDVAHFPNTPPLLGWMALEDSQGGVTPLAIVHGFVRNQGDGWSQTLTYLGQFLDECALLPTEEVEATSAAHTLYLDRVRQLGRRTAELHRALCSDSDDPAFRPEPVSAAELQAWRDGAVHEAEAAFRALTAGLGHLEEPARTNANQLLAGRDEVLRRVAAQAPSQVDAVKTRIHGDYHLGQVLVIQQDFMIIDFEGEPRKNAEERRRKQSPLRDVAGMLRSFDYAAWAALPRVVQDHAQRREFLQRQALAWRDKATAAFLDSYQQAIAGCPAYPADPEVARQLLSLFMIEKIFYELQYELASRPAWVGIPIVGAMAFLLPGALDRGHAE
jgi:maltose alpha-D-glucosyltransferase/alpha-amylase